MAVVVRHTHNKDTADNASVCIQSCRRALLASNQQWAAQREPAEYKTDVMLTLRMR